MRGSRRPPAPTKKTLAYLVRWSFLFCLCVRLTNAGGFEQQQRRPLPAAEIGRSCWGCGQQDARAAQGTMQPLGAATRAPYTARLAQSTRAHQELQYPIQIATRKAKISSFSPQKEVEFFGTENVKSWAPAFFTDAQLCCTHFGRSAFEFLTFRPICTVNAAVFNILKERYFATAPLRYLPEDGEKPPLGGAGKAVRL